MKQSMLPYARMFVTINYIAIPTRSPRNGGVCPWMEIGEVYVPVQKQLISGKSVYKHF